MKETIQRAITPLKENECFMIFDRHKPEFNFPLHYHPEYELNYISNAEGARRVVGDHIAEIGHRELVMVGPGVFHGWENARNQSNDIHEITVQFPEDLFGEVLNKNILRPIRELFQNAKRGILFPEETIVQVEKKVHAICRKKGFDSYLELQALLYELAISKNQKFLTSPYFEKTDNHGGNERIERLHHFVKANYNRKIKLAQLAELLNMSVVSVTRLVRLHTGQSFVDYLNEMRLGFATRMLIETQMGVSEICFKCGFNNISNFNRIFKRKQGITPTQFRNSFTGKKNVY